VIGVSTHDLIYRCHLGQTTLFPPPWIFFWSLVLPRISSCAYYSLSSFRIPSTMLYRQLQIATARWQLDDGSCGRRVSELEIIPTRSCLPLFWPLITSHADHNGILYSRKLRVLPKNLSIPRRATPPMSTETRLFAIERTDHTEWYCSKDNRCCFGRFNFRSSNISHYDSRRVNSLYRWTSPEHRQQLSRRVL
jgi:hypothetical protein